MLPKNQSPDAPVRRRKQRGQALVESALTVLAFLAVTIGIMDFGQLLFQHQLLVERVRAGARWGALRAWDGSGEQIVNVVLYNQSTVPPGLSKPFMGMKRSNVQVQFTPGAPGEPNDTRLTVAIVNYQFTMLSPWIAKTFSKSFAAVETVPMQYKP
jgi:hypothetical protein